VVIRRTRLQKPNRHPGGWVMRALPGRRSWEELRIPGKTMPILTNFAAVGVTGNSIPARQRNVFPTAWDGGHRDPLRNSAPNSEPAFESDGAGYGNSRIVIRVSPLHGPPEVVRLAPEWRNPFCSPMGETGGCKPRTFAKAWEKRRSSESLSPEHSLWRP